eukprot:scaffold8460_cov166-Amphora_coffeaeformis.AAC.7
MNEATEPTADAADADTAVPAVVVDTLIVGAGLSGAVALYELAQQTSSERLLILEARPDRCGGRSCTESIRLLDTDTDSATNKKNNGDLTAKEFMVDTGGQWLGRCQTKMMELVHTLGLELEEQFFPPAPSTSLPPEATTSSTKSDPQQPQALIELAYYPLPPLSAEAQEEMERFEQYLQVCYQTIQRLDKSDYTMDDQQKYKDLLQIEAWDQTSIGQVIEEQCTSSAAREQWYYLVQTVLAVDAHDCSFLFFLHYVYNNNNNTIDTDTNDNSQLKGMELLGDGPEGLQALKVKGGIQQISELLIDKTAQYQQQQQHLPAPSTPQIIRYGCEVVRIDFTGLMTSSSSVNDDDTPTGLIAPHDMIRVVTADRSMFDCRNVILAMAPTLIRDITFHPPLEANRARLYNHMIRGSAVKVILVFENAFWRHANHHQNDNGKSISQVGLVSNIFETTVGCHPALIGLLTGRHAEEYHAISDDEARQEIILTQIYDMYCREGNSNDKVLPPPLAFISKDWLDEPYSGGCFVSVVPPSSDFLFAQGSHLLRDPIVPHRLVVAATESSTQFYGYLEGAARAGARAAQEVLSTS